MKYTIGNNKMSRNMGIHTLEKKIDLAWKADYKIDASMDKTYFKDMT
jgi:hypothetical protein